jgi:TRAP-type C4-dicarboxylate transport system permease small subunit
MSEISNLSSASGAAKPDRLTALDHAVEPFRRAMRRLGLALLLVLIVLPSVQVFLRTVILHPFIGAEELARFILICVVFVTLPYVVSSGASIRMEEIMNAIPWGVPRFLKVLFSAIAIACYGIAAYSVAIATLRNLDNATPTLGIPYWVFFSTSLCGVLFSSVESLGLFIKALYNRSLYVTFAEEAPPEDPDLVAVLAPSHKDGGDA